jgi:glyoxylase-like metal-dependent hydrolase (beta-lactamase superfamily II)
VFQLRLEKLSEGVYANAEGLGGGNVGVICVDGVTVAVDAGYPAPAYEFRRSAEELTKRKVTHLILTHIHSDHIWGAVAFEDCDIVAHIRLAEKVLENLQGQWSPEGLRKYLKDLRKHTPDRTKLMEGLRIIQPKTTFISGLKIGPVEIIHTGGHTDCSSIVTVRGSGVVFVGDLLFVGRFPFAGDETVDPDAWIAGLESIIALKPDSIVPGHGPVCGVFEVEKQIDWFRAVRSEMLELIEKGVTEDEVTKHDFPKLYEAQRPELPQAAWRQWYRVLSLKRGFSSLSSQ